MPKGTEAHVGFLELQSKQTYQETTSERQGMHDAGGNNAEANAGTLSVPFLNSPC